MMNLRHAVKLVPLLLFTVLLNTGCAAFKNPVPAKPSPTLTGQWANRYPWQLCVRRPQAGDFNSITNQFERQLALEMADADSRWLVNVLRECRLFKSVTLSDATTPPCDLTIESLPCKSERTGYDDPWLLLYGGIFPFYAKTDESVNFKFIHGASGDFKFDWTEEIVIGFWAPVVGMAGSNWHFKRSSSEYWSRLHSSLVERFDQIHR